MEDLREQRDMRKAVRLTWLCIALAVLALVVEFVVKEFDGYGVYSSLSYDVQAEWPWASVLGPLLRNFDLQVHGYLLWSPNLLMILLPAAFFWRFQKGYHKRQNALLLIPIALWLIAGVVWLVRPWKIENYVYYLYIPYALETVLILRLRTGLTNRDRSLLRECGIYFVILAALTPLISIILYALTVYALNKINFSDLLTILNLNINVFSTSKWPMYKIFTSIIYALIAYRGAVTDDIALPGYPMRTEGVSTAQEGKS